jgi:hypothetical protein
MKTKKMMIAGQVSNSKEADEMVNINRSLVATNQVKTLTHACKVT